MPTEGLCKKCRRGYLVPEACLSTKETLYYCNNCYKYDEKSKEAVKAEQRSKSVEDTLQSLTEEDLDDYINGLFDFYLD